ncbi:MAG: adenylate/guanylate cyclase domain-containing protein [Actinomycetota bacterium]
MAEFATPEEEWAAFLSGTHPHLQHSTPLRFVPSSPRCKLCKAPFRGPGGVVFRRYGYAPWEKNPNICGRCFKSLTTHAKACPASGDTEVAGAEVELSMLFADVRGSSQIARDMSALEFTRLMNRFYRTSSDVLFAADAIVEKFVGDEVVGLFVPFLAGPDHTRKAVEAAQTLLRLTGHGAEGIPWVPVGAGVHRGRAFVGVVASAESNADFTALGDPVNIAAHLASQAAIGEVLVTDEAAAAAALDVEGLERRHLSLKGHPVDAVVVPADAVVVPAAAETATGA